MCLIVPIVTPTSINLTHTHSVLTAIFPGESGLAGCPPLILFLHLFLDCASFWDRPKLSMLSLTQSHQVFSGASSRSNSFNFPRYTTLPATRLATLTSVNAVSSELMVYVVYVTFCE